MDLIKRQLDAIPTVAAPLDLKFSTKRRQSPSCNISAAYTKGNQRCLIRVKGKIQFRALRPGSVVLEIDRETVDALRKIEKATQQVFWETIPFASIVDGTCARWRIKSHLPTLGDPPDPRSAQPVDVVLVVELVCAFFDAHKNKYGIQWTPKLLVYPEPDKYPDK